jgi:hypothetical protein
MNCTNRPLERVVSESTLMKSEEGPKDNTMGFSLPTQYIFSYFSKKPVPGK